MQGGVLFCEVAEDLLGLFPVALEGHGDRQLVPDEIEAGGVVGRALMENLSVGDVDDASGALVSVHPVSDLHQGELEQPHVDDVAPQSADLDAVSHHEGFAHGDEDPTGEICQGTCSATASPADRMPR